MVRPLQNGGPGSRGNRQRERGEHLTVAKLDVDANPETAQNFQVVSIPTLILFKDGQPVKRIVGAKGKAALLRELSDAVPNLS